MAVASPKCPDARGLSSGEAFRTLVDVLRWRGVHEPTAIAYRFLAIGEGETQTITYASLHAAASRLASQLQAAGLAGERVALLFPTEPSYIIAILGCLYAEAVAVPLNLPRPNRSFSRVESACHNAQPRAALTSVDVQASRGRELERALASVGVSLLTAESLGGSLADWTPPQSSPDSIAYLQYTSGSTADPKGVVVTHRNLWHNLQTLADVISECGPHVGVGWLPCHHDMGLVGTVFLPLWLGFPHVFMPPEAFIMKPVRWLQAISRYGGTLSPAPNFAYDLCVERVTAEQRSNIDLSSWRIAFNGSERIDPGVLNRFADAFAECGYLQETSYPCYGLAEATLFVSGACPQQRPIVRRFCREYLSAGEARLDEDGVPLVSCGRPRGETETLIVEPDSGRLLADGCVGEVWVSGGSVAGGYWRNPQATTETFHGHLREGASHSFLRTGDLGFTLEGELFLCGRLKDLIIVDGRNILPEDIEAAVEDADPAIRSGGAVAFAADGMHRERLIVVVELERGPHTNDVTQLRSAVRHAVAHEHDVAIDEVIFVRKHALPRTVNGKKQRFACRQAYLADAIRRRIDG